MNKLPEFNILLLGETGTGKSTTINALANYFQYDNFDAAQSGHFTTFIPTAFNLPHPDDNGGTVEIVSNVNVENGDEIEEGDELNDNATSGHSVTQSPFSYEFEFSDRVLRIIDTPGVGDTNGGTIDKQNLTNILAHIDRYKQLHGIVILFKATNTRTVQLFRYCFAELLVHLHKSACANLIFCFTYSRSSFFEPADGFDTLQKFLNKEMKHLNIKLRPHRNCFFIDNEAFRFLVAQKQNYKFHEEDISKFAESWNKSVEQSNKMFDTIVSQEAHDLSSTTLLNIGQKFIEEMAQPLLHLKTLIDANVGEQKSEEFKLKNLKKKKKDLDNLKTIQVEIIDSEELPHLRTVCSSAACSEVLVYENVRHYKSICHDECNCARGNAVIKTVEHSSLRSCTVLNSGQTCSKCGCKWQFHLYIKEEQTKMMATKYVKNIVDQIQQVKGDIKTVRTNLETLPKVKKEYEKEYEIICNICVKFACNIIKNSNAPFNKFLEPYFDLLINEETQRNAALNNNNQQKYKELKVYKMVHQQCVEILEKAKIEYNKDPFARQLKLEHISLYKAELVQLTHTGEKFEDIIETSSWKNITQCVRFRTRKLKLNRSFYSPNSEIEQTSENRNYAIGAVLILLLALLIVLIIGLK